MQEINDLRLRVTEMDNERLQNEKKLKSTKVSSHNGKNFYINGSLSTINNINKIHFLLSI